MPEVPFSKVRIAIGNWSAPIEWSSLNVSAWSASGGCLCCCGGPCSGSQETDSFPDNTEIEAEKLDDYYMGRA